MERPETDDKQDKSLMGFSRRTIEELKRTWRDLLGLTRLKKTRLFLQKRLASACWLREAKSPAGPRLWI